MNVCSLELAKELYELSGWRDAHAHWVEDDGWYIEYPHPHYSNGLYLPAYDLGYLLRKLPPKIDVVNSSAYAYLTLTRKSEAYKHFGDKGLWGARYGKDIAAVASTPEDACAKLCIELIKQGILPTDTNTKEE